ncbi:MAG TPA: hypothetical protein VMT15_18695 [Bryobacteraceae bacterium]|nr:hypothetical protein [Bryobacteraceae bacterium]
MGSAILLLAGMLALEDPPKDVIDFFRSMATALGNAHRDGSAEAFLEHFDTSMPGYAEFSGRIGAMAAVGEVGTAIDFVNVKPDGAKMTLDLDWLLEPEGQQPRRAVLQCTIEKRGKKWKVTSLAPLEFFKRD